MTSKKVIRLVAEATGQSQRFVKEFLEVTEEALKSYIYEDMDDKFCDIRIMTKKHEAYIARNPRTDERVQVPERYQLSLKLSRDWKGVPISSEVPAEVEEE